MKVTVSKEGTVFELTEEYSVLTQREEETKQELVFINEKYQGIVTEESIDSVIENLRRKRK